MLISSYYTEQNRRLHKERPDYGTGGHQWAKTIGKLCEKHGTQDVLDYGCGKESLKAQLPFVRGYDPCIDGLDAAPDPADIVVCTDVLEHIEPQCIDDVLDDLRRVTRRVLFCAVATGAAQKFLPDGRNAHLIQEDIRWWLPKLWDRFQIRQLNDAGAGLIIVATALSKTAIAGRAQPETF